MRDTYIQSVIKLSAAEKSTINSVYNAALKATQQSFIESSALNEIPVIDLLEGRVKYSPEKGCGVFYPNAHLKRILEDTNIKKKSVLLEKNLSRFAALLVHAYKDFHFQDEAPYQTWLESGHSGSEKDFIDWIKEKSR